MAKNKYYAVKKGAVPGIYTTWADCQSQVVGYSGAEFKGFLTEGEAKSYMKAKSKVIKNPNSNNPFIQRRVARAKKQEEIDAKYSKYKRMDTKAVELSNKVDAVSVYTDGGWGTDENKDKFYVGGFLIIEDGTIVKRACVSGNDKGLAELRNVAGEMQATVRAVDYVVKNMPDISTINLFVDYVGLIHWATSKADGGWKRKNEYTSKYGEYMENMKKKIVINLHHVKGHNKDIYNEEADCLATYSKHLYLKKEEYTDTEFWVDFSYIKRLDL